MMLPAGFGPTGSVRNNCVVPFLAGLRPARNGGLGIAETYFEQFASEMGSKVVA